MGASITTPQNSEFVSREATILFADVRGFTSFAAAHPATLVLELLNRYFALMTRIVARHGGIVDKFIGDAVMAIFGLPPTGENDAERAVECAVDMQLAMDELSGASREAGLPEMYIGVGVNTGAVMAGLLGSEVHSEYTVIGDAVNVASRIESFSLRGQVLMSEATHGLCRGFASVREPMEIYAKGKASPLRIYDVLGIPSLGKIVPRREVRRSPRVRVHLPFSYQVIRSKIVVPEAHSGVILDLGYGGALAATDHQFEVGTEIKLRLEFSPVQTAAADVYARIIRNHWRDGKFFVGMEFTSVSAESTMKIQQFVQLLLQGGERV